MPLAIPRKYVGPLAFAGLVALVGAIMIWRSFAATSVVAVEAEAGNISGASSKLTSVSGASGSGAVRFGGQTDTTTEPTLTATTLFSGKSKVWDFDFLPDGSILFNQRAGTMSLYSGGTTKVISTIPDLFAENEGGLMGLAVDPQFASNRYVFECHTTTAGDIRVVRWVLAADNSSLGSRKDIIAGIPNGPISRHGGCRIRFGTDGYLWVGTGDGQIPGSSQSKTALNGKILRVDREGVAAATGNLGNGFDARIYSYGHRNVQGLAFFPAARNGVLGVSAEHGPTVDDEINVLKSGNFGWAPSGGSYDENVPMTDKDQFPDAIDAIWESGSPTQAPSGVTVLSGPQWKAWDGAVVVGIMKAMHLKVLQLDASNNVAKETKLFQDEYGRIRTPRQGPDGNLYISTDNDDSNDSIIKLTPQ